MSGAESLCAQVLQQAPRNPDALYLLGVAQLAGGRVRDAVPQLKQALAANPRHGAALEHLGLAHLMLGEFVEAESILSTAAALPGAPATVLMRLGVALLEQGRADESLRVLRRALALDPQDATCHLNLGRALAHLGDVAAARGEFEAVLSLEPGQPDAMFNLGVISLERGELADARRWFERITSQSPQYADAYASLGIVCRREGRLDDALGCFRRALALNPRLAVASGNLAAALLALGRYQEGIAHLRELLHQDAADGWAWGALADALFQSGNLDEAVSAATRARGLDPKSPAPYSVLALVHIVRGEPEPSIAVLQEGFERTGAGGLLGMLAHQLRRVCDWQASRIAWEEIARRLDHEAELGSPFWLLLETTTAAQQLDYTRRWADARFGSMSGQRAADGAARISGDSRRVRIGYLSSEFHEHAIAHLLAGVLEAHDRARFEVHAYSYGPEDESPMRARLRQACEHFVDIARDPDDAVVRRIEADALDILVDLKGHTMGARTGILARRPCPIQVNWLGYPGTMGAWFIDYLIADEYVIPPGQESAYSERVVKLDHCWQSNDRKRPIAEPLTRAAYELPERGFVFCCFAQAAKFTPEIFSRWMNLLRAVSGSVLWLAEDNPRATQNLREAAAAQGVAPGRVVFAPRLPFAHHLARYRVADLALDTFPYTSHSTATDALWYGCPLVALCGETFAARVSGSILSHAGLSDLITRSPDEYEALAHSLATQPPLLESTRSRIAAARASSLFNAETFTRDLERIYLELVNR